MVKIWIILGSILWLISGAVGADTLPVLRLLNSIKNEDSFNYLVLMNNHNSTDFEKVGSNPCDGDCIVRNIMDHLEIPVMQLDERVSYILHDRQSSRGLSMVYLIGPDIDANAGLLKALVRNLSHMVTSRVVFVVQLDEVNETFLYKLFTYCWKMKLLNVLAVFEDYKTTNTFYSYTPFPSYTLERRTHNADSLIFPKRLRNFYGYSVRIAIGGAVPRIIVYYDRDGNIIYRGSLGHFMHAFQQKFNCTFVQPHLAKPNEVPPSTELVASVRNDTVDISFAITYSTDNNLQKFTYPFELMNWCLMLPVEADVPRAEYYFKVFHLPAFMLTLLLLISISTMLSLTLRHNGYNVKPYQFIMHDNCLRGALGQSFPQVKRTSGHVCAIYLQICLSGFLLTTWYNSYFSAYVTSVPKKEPFRSYDELMLSPIKVVAWKSEYDELLRRLPEFLKYAPMFMVEPSFNKFMRMGDSFDTRYGFMMATSKWVVVNEQQTIFRKPLFRFRNDMCVFNIVPLGFPVHENTIYRDITTQLTMDLAAFGLLSYWTSQGFSELVEAGVLHYLDHSLRREFRVMQLRDLEYVLYGLVFMFAISLVVFVVELYRNWLKLKREHTRIYH